MSYLFLTKIHLELIILRPWCLCNIDYNSLNSLVSCSRGFLQEASCVLHLAYSRMQNICNEDRHKKSPLHLRWKWFACFTTLKLLAGHLQALIAELTPLMYLLLLIFQSVIFFSLEVEERLLGPARLASTHVRSTWLQVTSGVHAALMLKLTGLSLMVGLETHR